MLREYQKFPKLAGHIEWMAGTGKTPPPKQWDEFVNDLDSALSRCSTLPQLADIKYAREKLKMSIRDVADVTGVSSATISRMENGKEANYNNAKALFDFYEMKLHEQKK